MKRLAEIAIVAAVVDDADNVTISAYCKDCGALITERTASLEALTRDKALRDAQQREDAAAVAAHYEEAGRNHGN